MKPQMTFFADVERIESLEETMIDLGGDVAAAIEARIVEIVALRTRLHAMETLSMSQARELSAHGDRLRVLEMRVGIRPKPATPPHATSREVAA